MNHDCEEMTGVMGYFPDKVPNKWSHCSKENFKLYYNFVTKVQGVPWCMAFKGLKFIQNM